MQGLIHRISLTFIACVVFVIVGSADTQAVLIDLSGGAGIVSDITIGGVTFSGNSTTVAVLSVHQNTNGLGARANVSGSSNQIDEISNGAETLLGSTVQSAFNSTTLSQIENNDGAIISIDGTEVFNGDIPDSGVINLGGVVGTTIAYTISDGNDDYKVLNINIDPVTSAAIPEPGSFALLGLGLIALCGFKRKNK